MQDIVLDDVTKQWADAPPALDHLDLTARAGELVGIVGPSGCGKTTAMRIVAGLETPGTGRVLLGARDITPLPSRDRHFGLVTQQNQLLSHLTAAKNISFPLEVRGLTTTVADLDRRLVREAAGLGIEHLLDRRPNTLSEGQRRLVQLARAVIGAPVALLMDEPLAFLGDQIRLRVRNEIRRLHEDRGLTSLLVTASQADAMAVCDRIAVLIEGRLEQYAPPAELYDRPATVEVARFFGEPEMNVLVGTVDVIGTERSVHVLGRRLRVNAPELDRYHRLPVLVGVRPVDLVPGGAIQHSVAVEVETTEPLGYQTLLSTQTTGGLVLRAVTNGAPPRIGTVLDVTIPADRIHLFDPATGMAIHHPRI